MKYMITTYQSSAVVAANIISHVVPSHKNAGITNLVILVKTTVLVVYESAHTPYVTWKTVMGKRSSILVEALCKLRCMCVGGGGARACVGVSVCMCVRMCEGVSVCHEECACVCMCVYVCVKVCVCV